MGGFAEISRNGRLLRHSNVWQYSQYRILKYCEYDTDPAVDKAQILRVHEKVIEFPPRYSEHLYNYCCN